MTRESPRDSENASGERAPDHREGAEERTANEVSREQREPRADGGDIPLDITGHEERKQEREAEESDGDAEAESEPAESDTPDSAEELIAEAPATPEPDPEDDEVEPVELLVQLAKDGEIEPWDIDIVAVTDKFLEAMDEADLRTSGRALFYASVLLRMKSDVMLDIGQDDEPEDEFPEQEPWEVPPEEAEGAPSYDPVAALETEMDRRLERKHARGNPDTLEELVRDLRQAERGTWWKESREYDTSDSPQGFRRGVQELDYHSGDDFRMDDEPTQEEALGNAHEEDIEATIEDVEAALTEQYGAGRTEVLYEEVADAGGSRVQTFLALLFLAHRGAITLEQDELFGDLWVCDETTAEAETPAAAD